MATLNQPSSRQTSPQDLKIGLFMPCYIDLVYPEAGIAALELLERFGLNVDYPLNQTCCGQPMSNSGDQTNARGAEQLFVNIFKGYDCIIGAAGSCVKQVRCHYDTLDQTPDVKHVREHTYELVEFLHDIVKVDSFPSADFPHSVAIHNSCSSVRGLGIAKPSEIMGPPFNKAAGLMLDHTPHFLLYNRSLNPWGRDRELPEMPKQTFREWYAANRMDKNAQK